MPAAPRVSSLRRKSSGVYVQVPSSPHNLDLYTPLSKATSTHVPSVSSKLKENTPFRPSRLQMLHSASASTPSLKRKLSDRDAGSSVLDTAPSASKKIKSASTGAPLKLSQINSPTRAIESASNACPDFPNGWTYCHQCCKKRDVGATIHCTSVEPRPVGRGKPKQRRCVNKFCRACLQNRYGEDLEILKTNKKRESGHVDNAGYVFKCPKCRDVCNCPRCRKSKGLEPIGLMRKPEELPATTKKEKQASKREATVAKQPKKRTPKVKPKIVPSVKWTPIAANLLQSEVEERIHIREFMLRFNRLTEAPLPKAHLEELEQINGKYAGQEGSDSSAWVSDACVKSIILALLGLLSSDDSSRISKVTKIVIKNLRTSAGVNLNKIWGMLVEWQGWVANPRTEPSSSSSGSRAQSEAGSFSLSEPRPPPISALAQSRRTTRGMTSTTSSSVNIISSCQMISVILSFIDLALVTPVVRQDFEEGLKQGKETARKVREATKLEGERWDAARKELEGKPKNKDKAALQAAKQLHKDILLALDNASIIAQSEYILRSSPLGTDPDGHVYYALLPGYAEREAALEYIEVMSSEVETNARLRKKGRWMKDEERDELIDWSWMILAWGKKPSSACLPPKEDDDEDEEMDDDAEGWWAFSHPSDIKELAAWLAIENGLEKDEKNGERSASTSTGRNDQAPIRQLISAFKDSASLLEWRSIEEKYRLPDQKEGGKASTRGNGSTVSAKTIPPERFYG